MVAPLIAAAAVGVAGGLFTALFGRKKPSFTQLTHVPLRLERLSETLPPSPERDAVIGSMSQIRQNLQPQFLDQAGKIGSDIDTAGAQIANYGGQTGALANQILAQTNRDPVTPYFGNFGERQADINRLNQQQLDAAYSNTGSQGGQALDNIDKLMSSAASRGLIGSTINRDQLLREQNTLRNMRAEQAAKLGLQGNQQMTNYGSLVNEANRNKLSGYTQVGNLYRQGADLAGKVPEMRINATQTLGNQLRGAAELGAQQENIGTEQKIQRQVANNNIANQEALDNVRDRRQVNGYNAAGGDAARNNTPSFGQSFLQGFSSFMPLGQAMGAGGGGGGAAAKQQPSYKPQGQSSYGSGSW